MWRAVVSQPLDRTCSLPPLGGLDSAAGEFWVSNPFLMPEVGENLSAYERNCIFLNRNGRDFIDASFASNADIDADSRSVMSADFDRDGAPDLYVASVGGGPLRLFRNNFQSDGARLRLVLDGTGNNRLGIGSRVVIKSGDQIIVRDLFPANGFQGMTSDDWLIGLGAAKTIDRLSIRWPNGKRQEFADLPVNRQILVQEASDSVQVLELNAVAKP